MRSMIAAVSMLACIPPALAQEVGDWRNPSFDPQHRIGVGDKPPPNPNASRDAMTLWQFIIGTSPKFGDDYLPIWQLFAMAENCPAGLKMIDDMSTEFGDRARGAAAMTSVRSRFRQWAGAQPQMLRLYGRAKLGDWMPEANAIATRAPRQLSTLKEDNASGSDVEPLKTSKNGNQFLALNVLYNSSFCPAGRGWTRVWAKASVQLDFMTASKSGLANGFNLPSSLPMSRDAAQAFVARNPSRDVMFEFHVAPASDGGRFVSEFFRKPVIVKRLVATDLTGAVIADMAF